jgi:leader peptidase (prepilin peptidase) / N-methyltransferase
MNPNATIAAALAALVGAGIGFVSKRDLDKLHYRRDDEQEIRTPRHRWFIPTLIALAAGVLTYREMASGHWQPAVLAVPILTLGAWLAAVDADVQRLPFKQVASLTILEAVTVVGIAIATNNPTPALWGAAGGVLCYAAFKLFAQATKGGIGHGDVTLAAPLGLATATAGGLPLTWWWLMASLGAAAIYGRARGKMGHHPLGPWLILGAAGTLITSV